jgi:hypothetical protein
VGGRKLALGRGPLRLGLGSKSGAEALAVQTLRVFRRGAPALASAFGVRALQRRFPFRVKLTAAGWIQPMAAKEYCFRPVRPRGGLREQDYEQEQEHETAASAEFTETVERQRPSPPCTERRVAVLSPPPAFECPRWQRLLHPP